jgi:molybdopterin molybdotransferase
MPIGQSKPYEGHLVQRSRAAQGGVSVMPGPLVPVETALAQLLSGLAQVAPSTLPVTEAVGRVLAEPIRVAAPVPARATALRDGWAVAAADVVGASSYSPVVTRQPPPWVDAGDPMPPGTDAVLPPDAVSAQRGLCELLAAAAPGEGTRRAGEDAAAGAVLRAAGERLRPRDAAVAIAAGVEHCSVRAACVRVMGLPGTEAAADLAARFAAGAGAVTERIALSRSDAAGLTDAVVEPGADMLLRIGAQSPGVAEGWAAALTQGGTMVAHGLALKPGETSGCGRIGAVPAILLPARLDGALAAMLTLGLPCLEHLMRATPRRPSRAGRLSRKVSSSLGLVEIVLVRTVEAGLEPIAVGDLALSAIAAADGWFAVPADSEGFAAGEPVAVYDL